MSDFRVHAIDPARLEAIRHAGRDEHGNPLTRHPAGGWEPLRCCLQVAAADEPIALISYSPFVELSLWRETGPVFVHADGCDGYQPDAGLPAALRSGPRVLRPYGPDGAISYDHIAVVEAGEDIEPALRKILGEPEVAVVHVRALAAQCFTYAVSRGDGS